MNPTPQKDIFLILYTFLLSLCQSSIFSPSFMSKPQPSTQENSKEDVIIKEQEQEEEKKESSEIGKGDEGFRTPTSDEHKIPESSTATTPPPAPKKRKKVFLHKRKLPKRELFENKDPAANEEVESFFESFEEENIRVRSEPDISRALKKARLDP